MPELPEVEILVRHLDPLLRNRRINDVSVFRERIIRPDTADKLKSLLVGARFKRVERRAKFLLFELNRSPSLTLLGHLGMTGRMYLQPAKAPLPRHAAVAMNLGRDRFIFEDTRYFGRLTLDLSGLTLLGPDSFSTAFTLDYFRSRLSRTVRSVKVALMDQSLVTGIGNIYASEILFSARISPRKTARQLTKPQAERIWKSIPMVLQEAIDCGSTLPLDFSGTGKKDGLFYFGRKENTVGSYEERLRVYNREGLPCVLCKSPIRRIVQANRSTFYCPSCQKG